MVGVSLPPTQAARVGPARGVARPRHRHRGRHLRRGGRRAAAATALRRRSSIGLPVLLGARRGHSPHAHVSAQRGGPRRAQPFVRVGGRGVRGSSRPPARRSTPHAQGRVRVGELLRDAGDRAAPRAGLRRRQPPRRRHRRLCRRHCRPGQRGPVAKRALERLAAPRRHRGARRGAVRRDRRDAVELSRDPVGEGRRLAAARIFAGSARPELSR